MKTCVWGTVAVVLALSPGGHAQNCCAPAVSQQGVLGETAALPQTLRIGLHYEHLRSRERYEGSLKVENEADTEADWDRVTLTAAYGVLPGFSAMAIVPYTWKEKSEDVPAGDVRVTRSSRGLGDVTVLARYSPVARTFVNFRELSVGLGLKLPTGSVEETQDNAVLPEELQPGTGSLDYLFSLSYYEGLDLVDITVSGTYVLTTEGDDYEFGNEFSYLVSASFRVSNPVQLSAALSGIVRGKDRQKDWYGRDTEIESTGRHQLWLVPGVQLQVIPSYLTVQLFWEQPIYQHFDGWQLGSDFNIRLTTACLVPLSDSEDD